MSGILPKLKGLVKKAFNLVGLEVSYLNKSPRITWLGLRTLPIRTIIDVGANKGQFASEIRKFFPEAFIHSFEPIPSVYEDLIKWAKKDGKAAAYNFALGEKNGEIEMYLHTEHTPSSLLKTTEISHQYYPFTKTQKPIKIKMTTLDQWYEESKPYLEPEILIKLDVQGYEDRVIAGGRKVFHMAKACIVEINLNKLYEGQPDFYQIVTLLHELGFKYAGNLSQAYADDGHVIFIDAVFVKRKG
ncbi:MAG: FkbM family methyltransferase [Caldimicrobium sp.]